MNRPHYLVNSTFGKIILRGIDAILPTYHKQNRAGWTTDSFGSLLTHPLKKIDRNQGIGNNYRDLLSLLVGKKVQVKIRMGTKESPKFWLEEKWRILTQKCIGQHINCLMYLMQPTF